MGPRVSRTHDGARSYGARSSESSEGWHVFNDFVVVPSSAQEAVRFDQLWKLPCVLWCAQRARRRCSRAWRSDAVARRYTRVDLAQRVATPSVRVPIGIDVLMRPSQASVRGACARCRCLTHASPQSLSLLPKRARAGPVRPTFTPLSETDSWLARVRATATCYRHVAVRLRAPAQGARVAIDCEFVAVEQEETKGAHHAVCLPCARRFMVVRVCVRAQSWRTAAAWW